jgi:hypothetical protein
MEALGTHASFRGGYFIAEESARNDAPRSAIYLDTTIVSYLTARLSRDTSVARQQLITRDWWDNHRHHHVLWISDVVLDEARAGDVVESKARLDAVAEIEQLAVGMHSERLAKKLVGGGRLPEKASVDARHVAIAATNSIPLLLTWNCKHLANPFIYPKIVQACKAEGFPCPEICTPEHLMGAYRRAQSPHC